MEEGRRKLMFPTTEELEKELVREKRKVRRRFDFFDWVRITLVTLIVLLVVEGFILPVYRVSGDSMKPTLSSEDLGFFYKTKDVQVGDIVIAHFKKDTIVKRVIALENDEVYIHDDGTVFVNWKELDEPYIKEFSKGKLDINNPKRVGDDEVFLMGDNRKVSLDSRSNKVGCIKREDIIGKLLFSF